MAEETKEKVENEEVKNEEVKEEKTSEDSKKKKVDKKDLQKEMEELKKQLAEKDDKYLRLAAEYDNFRRRTAQERLATYTDAVSDSIKEILPILDDLERAANYQDGEKVLEGLAIIKKSADNAMAKLGVESFGAPGDVFDANLHNAVMHEEDPEKGENEITDVFQKGYKKGDKIIRYAMVKVVN